MLEIKITIAAPEVAAAINNLANAMTGNSQIIPQNTSTTDIPTSTPATPVMVSTAVPTAQVATAPVAQPVQTAPLSAPTYTLEMISRAGTSLVDVGKMDELLALLNSYGVEAVTSLDPSMYGRFAADLRALGAQI